MDIARVEVHERRGTVGEAFKGGGLLVRNVELSSQLDGRGCVLVDVGLHVLGVTLDREVPQPRDKEGGDVQLTLPGKI
jgi:hypothetical protein